MNAIAYFFAFSGVIVLRTITPFLFEPIIAISPHLQIYFGR